MKNPDNKIFSDYLNALSVKEHAKAIKKIMDECMVSRAVVYSWKREKTKIHPYMKKGIEKALDQKIF